MFHIDWSSSKKLMRLSNEDTNGYHLAPLTLAEEDFLGHPKPFDVVNYASFSLVSNFNGFQSEVLF